MNTLRTLQSAGRLLAVMLVLVWSASQVLADAVAELARLRTAYEAYGAEIESDYSSRMARWKSDYEREIAAIAVTAQKAGEFENWQIATKEAGRFAASPTIPEQTPASANTAVRNLHQRYRTAAAGFREQREKQSSDLTTKYSQRLLALQTEATKAGKFDEALVYNEEIKRLEPLLDAISDKEKVTAKSDTPPEPAPLATTEEEPEDPGEDSAQPPRSDRTATPESSRSSLPEGVKISEGNIAPAVAGMTFRPLSLTPTQRMRVARKLSVQAEQSSKSSSSGDIYGARNERDNRVARIWIRPATTSIELENALLVVQFYGKDARASISRVTPSLEGQQKVLLPKISPNRWLFVQLVENAFERITYNRRSQRGVEFYGIIVSVFESSGELAYQAVSAPGLMDLVPQTIPEDPPPEENPDAPPDAF